MVMSRTYSVMSCKWCAFLYMRLFCVIPKSSKVCSQRHSNATRHASPLPRRLQPFSFSNTFCHRVFPSSLHLIGITDSSTSINPSRSRCIPAAYFLEIHCLESFQSRTRYFKILISAAIDKGGEFHSFRYQRCL